MSIQGRRRKAAETLVSVVVPAYNAAPFLERTLRSAMSQTYSALEILVVDDGSTDGTRAIALGLAEADSRINVMSVANGGVARARNIGIDQAKGEYVAFLDADDLWHSTKIALQMAALEKTDPTWGACYALQRPIDTADFARRPSSSRHRSGYILAQHLFAKFVGNGSSLLVRRQAAVTVGGFDPSYADAGIGGCEDLDFELKLAARYRIAAVPQFLIGYRIHPGNMSSDQVRMSRAILETVRRCLVANPDLPARARRYAWAMTLNRAAAMLWRDGKMANSLRKRLAAITNDPLLLAFKASGGAIGALRAFKYALLGDAAIVEPRPYLEMSPTDGIDQWPSQYYELRLHQLARIDAEREAIVFRSNTSDDSTAPDVAARRSAKAGGSTIRSPFSDEGHRRLSIESRRRPSA